MLFTQRNDQRAKNNIPQYKAYSSIVSLFKYSDEIWWGFWRFPHLIFVYNWIASRLVSFSCFSKIYHPLSLGIVCLLDSEVFQTFSLKSSERNFWGVNYNFSKLLTASRSSFRPHLSSLLNSASFIALLAFTQRKVRGFHKLLATTFLCP